MSKYKFEKIPMNESRFYHVSYEESMKLRKSANYWTMKVTEDNSRLSCHSVTMQDVNNSIVWLGVEVKRYEGEVIEL